MTRKVILWLLTAVVAVLALVVFNLLQPVAKPSAYMILPYSDLLTRAAVGDVQVVVFQGRALTGTDKQGRQFRTILPEDTTLASRLAGQGVRVEAVESEPTPVLHTVLGWAPSLLFVLVWWLSLRRMGNEVRALRRSVEGEMGRSGARGDLG